jgi:hypothetical protein
VNIDEYLSKPKSPHVPIWSTWDDLDADVEIEAQCFNHIVDQRTTHQELVETQAACNDQYTLGIINRWGFPIGHKQTPQEKERVQLLMEEEAMKKKYDKIKRRKHRL